MLRIVIKIKRKRGKEDVSTILAEITVSMILDNNIGYSVILNWLKFHFH